MDYKKRYQKNNKSDNYTKPDKTFQETLSKQAIKDYLKDYKKVTDITKISIGTHLRYFTNEIFRLGGTLNKFGDNGQYLILSNGKINWSVQLANTVFFQKLSESEIKEELKKELRKEVETEVINSIQIDNESETLRKENEALKLRLEKISKEFKKMSKKNELLESKLSSIENEIKKEKSKK
jgi:hypothetical protein